MAISMARARSGSTSTLAEVRCRPTSASLMMSSGSSLRGLSLVSTTRSLSGPAASPISGRLLRSRSPPQPKSVMMRAGGIEFARRGQQIAQSVVGVRVIHDHQERLPQIDALEAAGHRVQRGDAGFDGCRAECPSATPVAIAASRL